VSFQRSFKFSQFGVVAA